MTEAHARVFPPAEGVSVGQLVPRVRWTPWRLRLAAGLAIGLIVLILAMAALSLTEGSVVANDGIDFLLIELVFIILVGVSFGESRIASKTTELVVRLDPDGVEVAAEKYSLITPWSRVERLWVVHSGSVCPILCVATDDLSRFAPTHTRWRIKTSANRRLFDTPLATPLVNTGLSEAALLDAARRYLDESRGASSSRAEATIRAVSDEDPRRFAAGHHLHRRLVIGIATLAAAAISVVWLAAFAGVVVVRGEAALGGLEIAREALKAVGTFAIALAATLVIVATGARLYHAVVPLGNVGQFFSAPVLRVGPAGLEHIVRGRLARLPWQAVRRVYLTSDPSGSRFACVTTADPLALVPRVRQWRAKAKQNEQRYGAPVAVPLAGSGLTEQDLLNAVRYYTGGRATVGEGS